MSAYLKICYFNTCKEIIRSPFANDFLKEDLQRIWMFYAISIVTNNFLQYYKLKNIRKNSQA